MTSVNIPGSVTEIGYSAFENCDSLTICGGADSYAANYARANFTITRTVLMIFKKLMPF
ncbi:MAG: leucine-rich repeat domain-containing protein [Syntrophomonadaceae bacterium]|nr:leucine-rich repeat domain-containing protein [Syntrophomonadaceae bacterium]